jgi:hypothetical protein
MKSKNNILELYRKYYVDRDYEQIDLFQLLKNKYAISKVIYPGCYIHISPSFIFSDVFYIDSDKKAQKFFKDEQIRGYVCERKQYKEDSKFKFYGNNYRTRIVDIVGHFDLLISQYAGFISDSCKEYLKIGGILLINNSHGDAGLAYIDKDYQLIATIHKNKGKYRISYSSLDQYFIPKRNLNITRDYLYKLGKGVGYTKTAPLYIFQRTS